MVAKVLAVLSAALLVGAVALATLAPPDFTLGDALAAADHVKIAAVEAWVRSRASSWLWDHPVVALLARPLWLVPASMGLLLAGAAMTVATSHKAATSRRRRS